MIPVAKPYLTEHDAQMAFDTTLSGWVTQGPRVAEFENNFAEYVGSKYAVAIANCTAALHLALLVANVGEGDEVICPSLSFIATANAIKNAGAKPVFADVISETFNLDPKDVEARITSKTKAILLVHQIGMPAEIEEFHRICKEQNLILIEDAACAVGSSYQGKQIGSHSDLVCFSFHPRKVITTGDGGMVATSNNDYADRLRLLRQHGMSVNDRVRHESSKVIFEDYLEVGYNYRLTDIQAAVGLSQLSRLDWLIEERRKIAARYNEAFSSLSQIRIPYEPANCRSNYQSYSIYLNPSSKLKRNELMQLMLDEGISTRRGVTCIHKEQAYSDDNSNNSLPGSEDLALNTIILPLYVPMEEGDVQKIIDTLVRFVS